MSLDCTAAIKTYSFNEAPAPQESRSTPSDPPKPATKSDDPVREGVWRKLPSNFWHDQKDMWLFPVKVAEGRHWLPTAPFTGVRQH